MHISFLNTVSDCFVIVGEFFKTSSAVLQTTVTVVIVLILKQPQNDKISQ